MIEDLDGNAIGGLLLDVFGTEMTAAIGTCRNCGTTGPVAGLAVYLRGPGTVVRCPVCNFVLMVFVERHGITSVDLMGIAALG